jgi:hypothetical protein
LSIDISDSSGSSGSDLSGSLGSGSSSGLSSDSSSGLGGDIDEEAIMDQIESDLYRE